MDKKTILVVGIIGLAVLGFLAINKNKKAKSDADAQAQADAKMKADAAEKKRQEELARMNDPERKKLYDDIYLAIVELHKNVPENSVSLGKKAVDSRENVLTEEAKLQNANFNAYKKYEGLLPTLNQMSISELKLVLEYLKDPNMLSKDAFKFREWADLITKFPILGS